ncbi:MAG: hypothetical protein CL878_02695 [Dehalococcoidia bacterium]|nr:hypothetical protein [Dehalococcoidia bacterium]
MLSTHNMGSVTVQPADLEAMQASDYILHARDGELTKVPVEKVRLPLDPQGHVQRLCLARAPDGTIYAAQHTLLHRSTDGGATWEHLERDLDVCRGWRMQFDGNGAMLNVRRGDPGEPSTVHASDDEGETWRPIGQIDIGTADVTGLGFSMTRLDDGTLLVPVLVTSDRVGNREAAEAGPATCRIYRSQDGGRTWPEYSVLGDWCCEVNVAQLPSGRLLAAIRYQRPLLPDDPADLLEQTGASVVGANNPYKHGFVAHSDDRGQTWTPPRQVATVFGQCYGYGVGLTGNRAVVVTDHRYPRDMSSARAVVSLDGGETLQDEVYYLSHGRAAGYAATISLDGEEMLTLTGSCYGDVSAWNNCTGRTDFAIIRWRLV